MSLQERVLRGRFDLFGFGRSGVQRALKNGHFRDALQRRPRRQWPSKTRAVVGVVVNRRLSSHGPAMLVQKAKFKRRDLPAPERRLYRQMRYFVRRPPARA
jgi:hypothetical protein